jgi:hypothetical protein
VSLTSCVAVGNISGAPIDLEVVLAGTTWTATTQNLQSGADVALLGAVSCPTAVPLGCVAVGFTSSGPQLMALSAGGWATVTGPEFPAGYSILSGVSCSSPTACQAVGYNNPSGLLDVQLSGSTWSAAVLPAPAGLPPADQIDLATVSCASAGRCTALGTAQGVAPVGFGASPPHFTVMDRLVGRSWTPSVVAGPPLAGANAVACPAAGSCVLVGSYADQDNETHPLVATQSATAWTVSTFPAVDAALTSVSCPATGTCVAVGGGQVGVLAGGDWTFSDASVPSGFGGVDLTAVSCPVTGWCVAVGTLIYANNQPSADPVFETLSGGTWTWVAPTGTDALDSVSCTRVGSCVAVGSSPPEAYTLADGTWRPTSGIASGETFLRGIACHAVTECLAVGSDEPTALTSVPEADALSGTTWQPADLSNAGSTAWLTADSCNSATTCVAVGDSAPEAYGPEQALVETLADGSWTATTGIDPAGAIQTQLAGVFCHPAVACTAVGTTWPTEPDGAPSSLPVVEVRTG